MINKVCSQIWIGPLDPPTKWLKTWKQFNPDWEYILWDNEKVFSRKWHNQHIIDEYVRRYEEEVKGKDGKADSFVSGKGALYEGEKATLFAWHVMADVLRYEILYEYGGYMPGADSECVKPIGDRFNDYDLYTVNTGYLFTEKRKALEHLIANAEPGSRTRLMYDRYDPMNTSPILGAAKGNKFMKQIIDELHKLKPSDLHEAVDTTGNVFMGKMLKKYKPEKILINPHLVSEKPEDVPDNMFAIHHAGTTRTAYAKGRE